MILGFISLFIIILLCTFIIYKVLKEKSLSNAEKRQTFSILVFWVILWSLSILVTDLFSQNHTVALWASRLSFVTSALIGYWYYLFVRTYYGGKHALLGKIFWGIISFVFVILSITDGIVKDVVYSENHLQSIRGEFNIYFVIYTGIIFCYSAILFFAAYKREQNLVTKAQIFYIFLGSMLSILSSFSTNLIFPILEFNEIRALGPLSLIFFILATYYAILRYRFPSTKLIVSKLVYVLFLSIVPYAIFHLVSFVQNIVWGGIYEPEALVTGYLYSALFVFLFVFANEKLDVIVKKVFYDYNIDIQEEKEKLIIVFNDTLDVSVILDRTQNLLKRIFNSPTKILITKNGKILEDFKSYGLSLNDIADLELLETIKQPLIKDELMHVDGKESFRHLFEKYNLRVIFPIQKSSLIDWNVYITIEDGKAAKTYSIQDLEYIRSVGSSMAISLQRAFLYQEVEIFNKSLQEKVNEQTKELQIKVKELEEARKKEADMIDIMGHELRTPATVVKLNVELLEKFIESNPAEFKKYIDRIKKSVETEIGLINTLLTSAKLEGNKVEIRHDNVDIKAEIEMAVHGHEIDFEEKGIQFNNNVNPNTPNVYVDKVRVVEILNNLISNAIKYTQKGNVTVSTKYDDNFVTVSIQDTGKGIPRENLPKLGEKFYRVDNYLGSEIVRPGGTGLGLYVTLGLVRLMGGDIWVESEIGKGSTFSFTLPIYKGQKIGSSDSRNMFEKLGLKK